MEMNLEKFDPTVAELTKVAEESRMVIVTDFDDPKQIEAVRSKRIELKKTRVSIEKRGKELREDAIKFSKAVIAKERELIAIIEPEEMRLDRLEDASKQNAIEKERLRKWPQRLVRLKEIEFVPGTADTYVLTQMTDLDFEAFISNAKAKIEAEALARQRTEQLAREIELKRREEELEAKERKAKYEEELRKNAEREKADAEMREKKRLADLEDARIEGERQAKAKLEADAAAEVARVEREKEEVAKATARIEKTKKYKAFLESHGFTEATRGDFKIEETATGYVLYKRLGEFLK